MSMWAEIELRRFNPDLMVGRKNRHRRLEALALLLSEPISQELEEFYRRGRLAALFALTLCQFEDPVEWDWILEKHGRGVI